MNHTKTFKVGLLLSTLLLGSTLSITSHADEGTHRHQWSAEDRAEHFQKHMETLHSKLNLHGTQEEAWQSYVHKLSMVNQNEHADREAFSKLPAPERLEKLIAIKSEHLQTLQANLAALKEFYATLSNEQKAAFDLATQHHPKGQSEEKAHRH
jgi:thioredoxin-like negative regulator of GroEL